MNWIIISSGNGLSPIRRQAITWTNAGLLSSGRLGINLSEIKWKFKKMHLKMSSAKTAAILSRRDELTEPMLTYWTSMNKLWWIFKIKTFQWKCIWNVVCKILAILRPQYIKWDFCILHFQRWFEHRLAIWRKQQGLPANYGHVKDWRMRGCHDEGMSWESYLYYWLSVWRNATRRIHHTEDQWYIPNFHYFFDVRRNNWSTK